jgi:hypothetical protein
VKPSAPRSAIDMSRRAARAAAFAAALASSAAARLSAQVNFAAVAFREDSDDEEEEDDDDDEEPGWWGCDCGWPLPAWRSRSQVIRPVMESKPSSAACSDDRRVAATALGPSFASCLALRDAGWVK